MEIKLLKRKDFKKIIQFAIVGMNFKRYFKSKMMANVFGRYFFYLEYTSSSDVFALYDKDKILGALFLKMKNKKLPYKSIFKNIYIKTFEFFSSFRFKNGVNPYDIANEKLLTKYLEKYTPDGELTFLAKDPNYKFHGIGSLLIKELEKRYPQKEIYLFTDSDCNYIFYEHRGFQRYLEEDIQFDLQDKLKLKCYLYRKKLGN